MMEKFMIEWSSSRIDIANYCTMRYYLRYDLKEKPLRLSVFLKGSLMHKIIREFWQKLGSSKEVSRRGEKRYSNAEEFADYGKRMWNFSVIKSEKSKNPVFWNPQIGEKEKWLMMSNVEKICYHLFPILVEEGPPLFSELEFKFGLLGKVFRGFIDEIRIKNKQLIVRDYKTGRPYIGEMKLDFDPQLTIYNVAVGAMAYQDKWFAKKFGLESQRKSFMGNPYYVVPNLIEEFFMVEAPARIAKLKNKKEKSMIKTINRTKRTDNHFFEVIKMIDSIQERINSGNIVPERGRKCDYCDLKHVCKKKLEEVGIGDKWNINGQYKLEFIIPKFAKQETKTKRGKRKNPNQIRFHWRYKK